MLISALWGTCMERNYNKIVVSNDTEEVVDIPETHKIITIENYYQSYGIFYIFDHLK